MVKQTGIIFILLSLGACAPSILNPSLIESIDNKPFIADSLDIPQFKRTELLPLEPFKLSSSKLSSTAKKSLKRIDIQRRSNRETINLLNNIIENHYKVSVNTKDILRYQEIITKQNQKILVKTEHALKIEKQDHINDNLMNLAEKAILAIALVLVIIL